MSIDKHKTSSYNEYTICKFHTLPKCTITDRSGMILLHKSEKGHKLTLFSQKWTMIVPCGRHRIGLYYIQAWDKPMRKWKLTTEYQLQTWVKLRIIYPQDESHSYHISRLMDWEMKAERLDGSPGNAGAGMLRKDNNPWGARSSSRSPQCR